MSDSDDEILANLEEPISQPTQISIKRGNAGPSETKKLKPNDDFDLSDNSLLANISIPSVSSSKPAVAPAPATAPPATAAAAASVKTTTIPPAVRTAGRSNCVLVHPKQRGNPILKSIINVPWEFDDTVYADYVVGITAGILFLSLQYHQVNPDYIHNRLKNLGKRFELRILLVLVDTKDPSSALKNLTQICLLADLTLMLAWNPEEAGKLVETYKLFENKPPDLIMARAQQYAHQKLVTALTNIKPVNKTDAMTLLQNYGSLANLMRTSEDNLAMCAGLGPRKAKRLHAIFNEPFIRK